ncbi:MAG: ABC transporter permease [Candidatus Rokuibacteriota bacterium]
MREGGRLWVRLALLLPLTGLLAVCFTVPLFIMLLVSLSRSALQQFEWAFTLESYVRFVSDPFYWQVLGDTLWLGVLVTAVTLVLGYPVAYHLAYTRTRWKPLLLVFVLSPLLVGIVIRCYGWMILLADRGLVNATLVERGVVAKPLPLMYNRFGVALALVHVFLPFMLLSLTGVLKRIDPALLEGAMTLGASPARAFWEVTAPLSLPGVLAGSLLVFSLAISSFVVPILLGGFKVYVLPIIVYEQVLSVFDWPFGAVNAIVLLVISLAIIAGYIRVSERAMRGLAGGPA